MKIVTAASYREDMARKYPGAGPWINDPPECSDCGQPAAVLAELVSYDTNFGDVEIYRLCATCLQAALDGVKAAAAPPLTSPPSPC
jgi:hypothetical protein